MANPYHLETKVHGFLRQKNWETPILVVENHDEARPGYQTMKRHEYNDTPEVLAEKVLILADLLRRSHSAILYTGAGISTASGIKDYATQLDKSCVKGKQKIKRPLQTQPTFAHHALVSLQQHDVIKYWIQQNHDGLPQKAGYPQHLLNEIHGAWYDPSNPVVKMSGDLRDDLFDAILKWEDETDLCIALGTSLSGMNCDRVVTTVAQNAMNGVEDKLGAVIVGLQRTQCDDMCAIRIFAQIDDVMEMLLNELNIEPGVPREAVPVKFQSSSINFAVDEASALFYGEVETDVYRIPYSSNTGRRFNMEEKSNMQFSILDLRQGKYVKVTQGPYRGDRGQVQHRNSEGHYKIKFFHEQKKKKKSTITKQAVLRTLGFWWITAAVEGTVSRIPVVNLQKSSVKSSVKMMREK
mmetsp:Transcript_6262/g.8302  ORF Transcript_6262/g.8302 Transcript_6262/m.8302 type:complete len:410 (-) Transcript_6262:112-1341(-)